MGWGFGRWPVKLNSEEVGHGKKMAHGPYNWTNNIPAMKHHKACEWLEFTMPTIQKPWKLSPLLHNWAVQNNRAKFEEISQQLESECSWSFHTVNLWSAVYAKVGNAAKSQRVNSMPFPHHNRLYFFFFFPPKAWLGLHLRVVANLPLFIFLCLQGRKEREKKKKLQIHPLQIRGPFLPFCFPRSPSA